MWTGDHLPDIGNRGEKSLLNGLEFGIGLVEAMAFWVNVDAYSLRDGGWRLSCGTQECLKSRLFLGRDLRRHIAPIEFGFWSIFRLAGATGGLEWWGGPQAVVGQAIVSSAVTNE